MGADGHVHGKPKDNVRVPNVCGGGQVSQARNIRMAVYKLLHLCLREITHTLNLYNTCMGKILQSNGLGPKSLQFSDC